MRPKVSVVVLNWNKKGMTIDCIDSLKKLDYPNYEIIVVDNNSTDGSCERFRKITGIKLICLHDNLGYTGGNNRGIKAAKGDYVLVLNNDTIFDKNFLTELVSVAESNKNYGILGPKIYYYDKKDIINTVGIKVFMFLGIVKLIGKHEKDIGQYDTIRKVDVLMGAALFIRRAVIEKIGLFDEKMFMFGDEMDYCIRAKKAGFECVYVPKAKMWHKESATVGGIRSPFVTYYSFRNQIYFVMKHGGLHHKVLFLITFPLYFLFRFFQNLIKLKTDNCHMMVLAVKDYMSGKMGKTVVIEDPIVKNS